MDLINISGLTLNDRKYYSYQQEGRPNDLGSPIFKTVGGVFTTGGFSYSHLDAVPLHFTSDGKLMVDTELEVSGVVIGNVKVFSTDGTAPNAKYGLVTSDGTQVITQSGAWVPISGQNYTPVYPSGVFHSRVDPSGIFHARVDSSGNNFLLGSQTFWANTIPSGNHILSVSGTNYTPVYPSGIFHARVDPSGIFHSRVDPSGTFYTTVSTSGGALFILGSQTNFVNCVQQTSPWAISGVLTIGSIAIDIEYLHVEPSGIFHSRVDPSGIFHARVDASGGVALPISGAVNQGTDPWTVTHSGTFYVALNPTGTFYSSVSTSGGALLVLGSQTQYVNCIQQTSPWAISGVLTIGSIAVDIEYLHVEPSGIFHSRVDPSGIFHARVDPSGTFILGSQTIWVNSIPSGNHVLSISGLNYAPVYPSGIFHSRVDPSGIFHARVDPSGTFILGSQTIYTNVSNIIAVSGNNYSSVIPSGVFFARVDPSGVFYSTIAPSGTFILGSQTTYSNSTISGGVYASVSGTALEDFTLRYTQRVDYATGTSPIYMGLANPGTATNAASWQIRKYLYSGVLQYATLWGSGNTNFNKVWDSRSGTGEAYS